MRVSKKLVYGNLIALSINAVIVWLTIIKTFPPILGIALIAGSLAGLVWLSCKINGKLPAKKPRPYTFYSAPTEEVETL